MIYTHVIKKGVERAKPGGYGLVQKKALISTALLITHYLLLITYYSLLLTSFRHFLKSLRAGSKSGLISRHRS